MKPPKPPKGRTDHTDNGPRPRVDRPLEGPQSIIDLTKSQVSFDADKFDFLIKTHGVRLVHQRALPDPRGMASRGDNRDVMNLRPRNSDGYIYKNSGHVYAWFHNNTKDTKAEDMGNLSFASVYLTVTRYYEDSLEPVILQAWDRFYLADIEMYVSCMQYMEASSTGIDRLQFPALKVVDLVDANGEEYTQDKDFVITSEGWLKWTTQRRPGYNPTIGRETVYAVRYLYTPFFIVDKILHEIRVTNVTDPLTYERKLERMPFEVLALRENIFMDKNRNDPARPLQGDDPRSDLAPRQYSGIYPEATNNTVGNFGAPPTKGPKT
jgi:hypothetical protein